MKLVSLNGPPGVGKLTVAKELSKLTGYPVLHNHLTLDVIHAFLSFKHPQFWKIVSKFRKHVFKIALTSGIPGIIKTGVYAHGRDDTEVKRGITQAKKLGAKIYFVWLHCDHKTLHRRIQAPSRKGTNKINTLKVYLEVNKKHDLHKPMPFVRSFALDNTHISAKKAALLIVKHYKLPHKK
ncbi:MAG: AAA family ATPase [Nanoarchaeota archaeon]